MAVTAVRGKLPVHFEKVPFRQIPHHFPQVGGNRDIAVFPRFAVLQRAGSLTVSARLLEYPQHSPIVPETGFLHSQRFLDPQAATAHQPDRQRVSDPAYLRLLAPLGEHEKLRMRRKHEIIMIPVPAVVRQGNPTAAVHGDLPRRDSLVKNARDQRTGDLAARIAPLAQPDCQQIYHVIACLRDRCERPVSQDRADVGPENALVSLLGQLGARMASNPLLALIPEPRAAQLGVDEHPSALVVRDLELSVLSEPLPAAVPRPALAVQFVCEAQLTLAAIGPVA